MKIIIESIPHASQRYPTCGDWFLDDQGTMQIKVSEEMGDASCFLVALHELFEAKVAMNRGVTVKEVDDFDTAYEKAHRKGGTLEGERLDDSEPGDDPTCPVFVEHGLATAIEQIACVSMGIAWHEHDKRVNELP